MVFEIEKKRSYTTSIVVASRRCDGSRVELEESDQVSCASLFISYFSLTEDRPGAHWSRKYLFFFGKGCWWTSRAIASEFDYKHLCYAYCLNVEDQILLKNCLKDKEKITLEEIETFYSFLLLKGRNLGILYRDTESLTSIRYIEDTEGGK